VSATLRKQSLCSGQNTALRNREVLLISIIGRQDRKGNRRPPVFPHDLWNVHDRVSEALPRTSVEAWHHTFQQSLQCWHSNLWKFIDALKKEERLQRLNITQLLLGQVVVSKKTYRMTDEGVSNSLLFAIMLTAHLPNFCVLLHTTCDFNLLT